MKQKEWCCPGQTAEQSPQWHAKVIAPTQMKHVMQYCKDFFPRLMKEIHLKILIDYKVWFTDNKIRQEWPLFNLSRTVFRILINMAVEQGDHWPTTKLVMLQEAAAAEASPDSLGSHIWGCHHGSTPQILIVQAETEPWVACWGLFGRFLAVILLSFLRYPSCWGVAAPSTWGTDLSLGISPALLTLWQPLLNAVWMHLTICTFFCNSLDFQCYIWHIHRY